MAIQQSNSTVQLGIRVTTAQRRQLRMLAAERDVSVQTLVQAAIAGLLSGASGTSEKVEQEPQPKGSKPAKTPKKSKGVSAEEFARGLGLSTTSAQALLDRAAEKRAEPSEVESEAEPWDPAADPFEVAAGPSAKSDEVVDLQADPFA